MLRLHDPGFRASIQQRVRALTPSSERQWGQMTVDQMLHHVNTVIESALGRLEVKRLGIPLPQPVIKWIVLYMPWPKGSATAPEFVAGARYDFEAERARCLALIDELTARPIDGAWPYHHTFGPMTGADVSRLQAKHLDHHLRQFSA